MNIGTPAITVVVREDGENTLVLGAYTNYEQAVRYTLEDINRVVSSLINLTDDERQAELDLLISDLNGTGTAIGELSGFSWDLQNVAPDTDPLGHTA